MVYTFALRANLRKGMRVRLSPSAQNWPHRIAVSSAPFHGVDIGSYPIGVTMVDIAQSVRARVCEA